MREKHTLGYREGGSTLQSERAVAVRPGQTPTGGHFQAPAAGGGAYERDSLELACPFPSFLLLPPRLRFPAAPDVSPALDFFEGIGRDPVSVADCGACEAGRLRTRSVSPDAL